MKRSGGDRFANDKSDMNRIFFTADLHFGHQNILRYQTDRPFADRDNTTAHDAWLLDLWRSTVDKKDMVYILGDLTFFKSEDARHLLEKLPGRKYLITGNHDGSVKAYSNYFQTTAQILDLTVRPSMCSRLTDNMVLNLCHYPLLTWNRKPHGSVMLHGHCHGKLDEYNRQSPDLRFDVGIDGELSRRCGGFVNVEAVYEAVMEKTKGESFAQYARQNYLPEYR